MAIEDYYVPMIIKRVTTTDNGMGGYSEVWNNHLDILGLINQADSKEVALASQMDIKATHKLYTDAGQDITNKDRVLYKNEIYRITSLPKDTVNRGHHYKIMLEYIGSDNDGL